MHHDAPRLACALAGVVLLAGCSGGSSHRGSPASSSVSTTSIGTTTSSTAVPSGPDPATLVVSDGPVGYQLQPDSVADTGPTDLAKAARDDLLGDALQMLQAAGFQRGYQRQWRHGTDVVTLYLYQFAASDGGFQYVDHSIRALRAQGTIGSIPLTTSPVALIPFAQVLAGADKNGSVAAVLFVKGAYAVRVDASGAADADLTPIVEPVAAAQFARLP